MSSGVCIPLTVWVLVHLCAKPPHTASHRTQLGILPLSLLSRSHNGDNVNWNHFFTLHLPLLCFLQTVT